MEIHVVGLGVKAQAVLCQDVQSLLASLSAHDKILGSARQLETLGEIAYQAQSHTLPKLADLADCIKHWQQQGVEKLVVLASGDALHYGIGAWLGRFVDQNPVLNTIRYYANVSSVQEACHRLGLSLQDAQVVSLHGRPLFSLRRYLQPNRHLLLLTDQFSQPQHIAKELLQAGLDDSQIQVCEALGYGEEKVTAYSAKELAELAHEFNPLNVVMVTTSHQASFYPSAPGIAESRFVTDKGHGKGMITKREVRLAILSYMALDAKDVVWDIGAGCGGVSVELAYWQAKATVYGIEHHPERLACLEENRQRFGVMQNLQIIAGRAPQALVDLPLPNKVFIGGSDGALEEMMNQVWCLLPEGGRLVVSAVTETSRCQVMSFMTSRDLAQDAEDDALQIAISRCERLAGQRVFRPSLPVNLYQFIKTKALNNEPEHNSIKETLS